MTRKRIERRAEVKQKPYCAAPPPFHLSVLLFGLLLLRPPAVSKQQMHNCKILAAIAKPYFRVCLHLSLIFFGSELLFVCNISFLCGSLLLRNSHSILPCCANRGSSSLCCCCFCGCCMRVDCMLLFPSGK